MSSSSQLVNPPPMDGVMVLGFLTGFLTIVCLMYRRELCRRWPLLAILLLASAVYGFLCGCWPLGFVMIAMATAEVQRWRAICSVDPHQHPASVPALRPDRQMAAADTRMSRMFDN